MTPPRWTLVATVFLAQAIGIGGTFGAFTVFVDPVSETFAASRSQVSIGISLMALMIGVMGPIWGRWIDGGAFRRIMLCGSVALTSCLVAASFAPTLVALGGVCIAVGITAPLVGPLTGSALLGKVFVESRGRAIGIASMGPPAGGAIFALMAGELITSWDWRVTLQVFAAISALLIPLVALTIPRRVESGGAAPGGEWTPARLLRSADFWGVALAMGIAAGVGIGWASQLAPFASDLGHDLEAASRVAAIGAGTGIFGTLGFGILADRWNPRWLFLGVILGQTVAFALYLSEPGYTTLLATAALFGTCAGSLTTLYALVVTERFGPAGLGQSLGLTNIFILPFGAMAPLLAATLRDSSGSYALPIVVLGSAMLIAAGSVLVLHRRA